MMERDLTSDDEDEDIWEYKTKKRLKIGNVSKNESSAVKTDDQKVNKLEKTFSRTKNKKVNNRKRTTSSRPSKTKTAKEISSGSRSSSSKDLSQAKRTESRVLVCSEPKHVSKESTPGTSLNVTLSKPQRDFPGSCPSCQMPLFILIAQTPTCHVTECLDLDTPTTGIYTLNCHLYSKFY